MGTLRPEPRSRSGVLTGLAAWTLLTCGAFPTAAGTLPVHTLFSIPGEASDDFFGGAVAGNGDFNGDGYADLLVGADRYDIVGKAYLYYGGPNADAIPDVTFGGAPLSGVRVGFSVAFAGDLNGDGFDDVIIGDPLHSYPGGIQGNAQLYYGGANPDNVRDLLFWSVEAGGTFYGWSVAGAGDFNADGYDDLVIGEPGSESSAYVYFGGPGMDAVFDVKLSIGTQAGHSVAGIGDFNGDGYDDLAVGVPIQTGGRDPQAHVYFGGPNPNAVPDVIVFGEIVIDVDFGYVVAGPGDVDGDGYDDLLVGAPRGAGGAGRVYMYRGSPTGGTPAPTAIHQGEPGSWFGTAVAGAGDCDGDVLPDYIIGAPRQANPWDPPGYVVVHSAVSGEIARVAGVYAEKFGQSVGSVPIFEPAEMPVIVVGGPWNDEAGYDAGRVWIGAFPGVPTPSRLSLIELVWSRDRVVGSWYSEDRSGFPARVERRSSGSTWQSRATVYSDGTGTLHFEDRDVEPGERYAYRLAYEDDGGAAYTDAAWIDVPGGVSRLHLSGFMPNPCTGTPVIGFTLAKGDDAHIEVIDLSGRLVFERDIVGLGTGRQTLRLDSGARLAPGAYVIRLREGTEERRSIGVVLR